MRMQGKVGLVTAAASGMGRAGALRFAAEGAAVGVADVDAEATQAVVDEIIAAGGRAFPIVADLRDLKQAAQIVEDAAAEFGKLDFVWNHLGHPGPSKVEGMDQELFELSIDLNLKSVMATSAAAVPHFRKAGGGAFLFTASTAGLVGSRYSPSYSMMKHGVVGYTKALAMMYAEENIRANVICPGPVETPMFHQFGSRPDQPSKTLEEVTQNALGVVPLKRIGKPEEVANAALFLLSDEASFITGAALPVDGGVTAR